MSPYGDGACGSEAGDAFGGFGDVSGDVCCATSSEEFIERVLGGFEVSGFDECFGDVWSSHGIVFVGWGQVLRIDLIALFGEFSQEFLVSFPAFISDVFEHAQQFAIGVIDEQSEDVYVVAFPGFGGHFHAGDAEHGCPASCVEEFTDSADRIVVGECDRPEAEFSGGPDELSRGHGSVRCFTVAVKVDHRFPVRAFRRVRRPGFERCKESMCFVLAFVLSAHHFHG
jgi:hypothetical protein